jgi:hypothetical protein
MKVDFLSKKNQSIKEEKLEKKQGTSTYTTILRV